MPINATLVSSLRQSYAPRHIEFRGIHELEGSICKEYEIRIDDSPIEETDWQTARELHRQFLATSVEFDSVGLSTIIVHAGADGTYILVHEWIEGFMSRQRIYIRDAGSDSAFRAAPDGQAPCIWERAVYDHENIVFRQLLASGDLPLGEALSTWKATTYSGHW